MQRSDWIALLALAVSVITFAVQWWRGRPHIVLEIRQKLVKPQVYNRTRGRSEPNMKAPSQLAGLATIYNRTGATVVLQSKWASPFHTESAYSKNYEWEVPAGERKEIQVSLGVPWDDLLSTGDFPVSVRWAVIVSPRDGRRPRISRTAKMALKHETIKTNAAKMSLK